MFDSVEPTQGLVPPDAEAFYCDSLQELTRMGVPFLLGGTYAVCAYTGISRPTKDLDVFCRPGDYPRILAHFQRRGCDTEIEDERWIAKVKKDGRFFDVIFNSSAGIAPVSDHWFEEKRTTSVYGVEVQLIPPTEMLWSKMFVQDRLRYDGADVVHLVLKQHQAVDWKRLLWSYMDPYWEVLLIHVLNFDFIYPTERECVPQWLREELLGRLRTRYELPVPQIKICRGRLFSRRDYEMDVKEWGFAGILGERDRKDD